MAKWYGAIGFGIEEKIRPGVVKEMIKERSYYGDVNRLSRRLQIGQDSTNPDISVSNELSVLADPFANENFQSIRYVTFMGTKWTVSSVEVQYPRLLLTLGGVYNGDYGPQT